VLIESCAAVYHHGEIVGTAVAHSVWQCAERPTVRHATTDVFGRGGPKLANGEELSLTVTELARSAT